MTQVAQALHWCPNQSGQSLQILEWSGIKSQLEKVVEALHRNRNRDGKIGTGALLVTTADIRL